MSLEKLRFIGIVEYHAMRWDEQIARRQAAWAERNAWRAAARGDRLTAACQEMESTHHADRAQRYCAEANGMARSLWPDMEIEA